MSKKPQLDPSGLDGLINTMDKYLQAFNEMHSAWLSVRHGEPLSDEFWQAKDNLEEAGVFVRTWLKVGAMLRVIPPVGVTRDAYVADLLSKIDRVWHLFRFAHCLNSQERPKDPTSESTWQALHDELPVLYDAIRQSWLHLKNAKWVTNVSAHHVNRVAGERSEAGASTSQRPALGAVIAGGNDVDPAEDEQADPLEEILKGQLLSLYLFLRPQKHWTKFDTIRSQEKFWRKSDPEDPTIVRALRRLREELTAVESSPVALTIDMKHRRTKLDK